MLMARCRSHEGRRVHGVHGAGGARGRRAARGGRGRLPRRRRVGGALPPALRGGARELARSLRLAGT